MTDNLRGILSVLLASTAFVFNDAIIKDGAPKLTIKPTGYGFCYGARRDVDADEYYWRVTQFLVPTYTMIPSEADAPISFTAAVPLDDTHTAGYTVTWRPDRPLSPQDVARIESWTGIYAEVDPRTYTPLANRANDYRLDREKQRRRGEHRLTEIQELCGVRHDGEASSPGELRYGRVRSCV